MWYIYKVEYYSAIKNNEFLCKCLELNDIILSEVTQSQKYTHSNHSLIKWILAKKLRILKIQLTDHMKLKKKKYQIADTLILLGRWINIWMAYNQLID